MDLPRRQSRRRSISLPTFAALLCAMVATGVAVAQPAAAAPEATAPDAPWTAAVRSGFAALAMGHFDDAVARLETADQLAGGRSPEVEVLLARAYAAAGSHDKALAEARTVLGQSPALEVADQARVVVCQNRGEASAAEDAGEVVPKAGEDGVTRPQVINHVNPEYPVELRKARAQATVILGAMIDEEGCVTEARVLRGAAPEFDAASLEAIMKWVFRPATANGQPVKVRYTLTVNFQIGVGDSAPLAKPTIHRDPAGDPAEDGGR